MRFHFGYYISLETSLLWGVLSTFVNYVVTPYILKIAKRIPNYVTIICIIIFIIDCLYSFRR